MKDTATRASAQARDRRLGLLPGQYDHILKLQKSKCAICGKAHSEKPEKKWARARLAVDHDHSTGKVRGLLCFRCNTGLGSLGDDLQKLQRAVKYLKRFLRKIR